MGLQWLVLHLPVLVADNERFLCAFLFALHAVHLAWLLVLLLLHWRSLKVRCCHACAGYAAGITASQVLTASCTVPWLAFASSHKTYCHALVEAILPCMMLMTLFVCRAMLTVLPSLPIHGC